MNKPIISILDDDSPDKCYLCGAYGEHLDVHHIFEGSKRQASDRHRLIVHVCRDCHRYLHDKGGATVNYLHTKGQMVYEEKIGTRDEFRKEFIGSYL